MIIGIGVDMVRIDRIEQMVLRYGDRFLTRIYTDEEKNLCALRKERYGCLAKRFAAKEAVVKAMGTGMSLGIFFRDIEVILNREGQPHICLHGLARQRLANFNPLSIHLSLSDESGMAMAFVVLETRQDQ